MITGTGAPSRSSSTASLRAPQSGRSSRSATIVHRVDSAGQVYWKDKGFHVSRALAG